MATLAPDDSRVKDQIKRIQNYVWAVYIDGTQPQEQIEEEEALATLDAYYSEVGNRNSPDQVYLGILLFERAFEDPDTQAEGFERARKIFEFYRRITGEDDWSAVEDRLEDIADFFDERAGPVEPVDEAEVEAPVAVETVIAPPEPVAPAPVAPVVEVAEIVAEPEAVVAVTEPVVPAAITEEPVEAPAEPVAAEPAPEPVVKVEPEQEDAQRVEAEENARRREAAEAFTAGLEVVEGMCLVPAGTFLYGVDQREIFLDSFYIDMTVVTNAEYMRFVREMGYRQPRYLNDPRLNHPDQPIVGVSFGDAQQFAKWAGKELPTEMQWEKAASGTDGRPYPWGNDPPGISDACYGQDPVGGAPIGVGRSSYNTSAFGVRDMCGNVWEWTTTQFQKDSAFRVVKGGCYNDPVEFLRIDFRQEAHPKDKVQAIGFRCVKNIHG